MKLFYTETDMVNENKVRYTHQPCFREIVYPLFPIILSPTNTAPWEITDYIVTYKRVDIRQDNQKTYLYILEDQIDYVLNLLNIEKY